MVCLGNICRSPLADGLLREKVKQEGLDVMVDSCGTSGHHAGESPDNRMTKTAKSKGIDISDLRSRQITKADLDDFDIIYVMDESNKENVLKLTSNDEQISKIRIYLNEAFPGQNLEVPDPYYGGDAGFEHVFSLVERNTEEIITKLKSNSLA